MLITSGSEYLLVVISSTNVADCDIDNIDKCESDDRNSDDF